MSVEIDGGFNRPDPIRAVFEADARPHEQDPAVLARAPEIVLEGIALCAQYANSVISDEFRGRASLDMVITGLSYRAPSGVSGAIALSTHVVTTIEPEGHTIDRSILELHAIRNDTSRLRLFELSPTGLSCGEYRSYTGNQADLNFFVGVLDKIRDALRREAPEAQEQRRKSAIAAYLHHRRTTMGTVTMPSL